jgi:hypothetical protein
MTLAHAISLPKHKNAILGLITSKFSQIEDKAEMKMNVYTAAELVAKGSGESKEEALQRLGVSPQCGFAGGKSLGHGDMINKLTLVGKLVDESFTKRVATNSSISRSYQAVFSSWRTMYVPKQFGTTTKFIHI